MASFASGYQALFLSGALFMLVATILTWRLVSAAETPPVAAPMPFGRRRRCAESRAERDHEKTVGEESADLHGKQAISR